MIGIGARSGRSKADSIHRGYPIPFNIVEPSLPPQIYEWAPKVITSWMHWLDVLPEGR